MNAFQPILTCFLYLFIADIAVRGMHTIDKRNFMCSQSAASSKLSLITILGVWNSTSASISSTAFPVTWYYCFCCYFVFIFFINRKTGFRNQIKFLLYSLYYAEACNELKWPFSTALRCKQYCSFKRYVAAVVSRRQHCVQFNPQNLNLPLQRRTRYSSTNSITIILCIARKDSPTWSTPVGAKMDYQN